MNSTPKKYLKDNIIPVIQGDYHVTNNPEAMMKCVLGSCVAVCMYDAKSRIGGMNHFLLPGVGYHNSQEKSCGLNMMELLINGLLRFGARRKNFEAKIFGGAHITDGLSDIGAENAEFARAFLTYEGIPIISESLGGTHARRLRFWPSTGNAKQLKISTTEIDYVNKSAPKIQSISADVELF